MGSWCRHELPYGDCLPCANEKIADLRNQLAACERDRDKAKRYWEMELAHAQNLARTCDAYKIVNADLQRDLAAAREENAALFEGNAVAMRALEEQHRHELATARGEVEALTGVFRYLYIECDDFAGDCAEAGVWWERVTDTLTALGAPDVSRIDAVLADREEMTRCDAGEGEKRA